MLWRETRHYGHAEVNADTEFSHPTVDDMSVVIPYSAQWNKVLVQVSGGLDSALMLYLLAKNLRQLNSHVQIQPLSFEVPLKAKSLSTARAVIKKVRELTGFANLLPGIEVDIPSEKSMPPYKDRFFIDTIRSVMTSENISFEFNGNTKNPPQDVRHDFREDQWRQLGRDNRTTIYNTQRSASPNALVNKKGIVGLYKSENILESLAPLTLSCDMDLEEILRRKMPVPCGECWWCRERAWGFSANGLADPQAEPPQVMSSQV